ncbi:MarR family winged helix-turn-helix transcriptional regulator [Raoultibacter phocaeensis]|uniref:MarR family winged helix-turn-helix transcriptional regulator n=1 Tax=Raoultibacter phocaeensis TaxID=2479841 RepID=UPI001119F1B6|nr:MarR family transcriptional regulator [Raoultibacter phocaeensis]
MIHDRYPMTPRRELLRKLASFSNRMKRLKRMRSGELSGNQMLLLPVIDSFEEPPTLGELADANESSYQNTRQILDKLASTGYVAISADPNDSRAIRALLTDKGTEAVAWYYKTMYEPVLALFEGLDDTEVEAALKVVSVLYDRIDTLHRPEEWPQ